MCVCVPQCRLTYWCVCVCVCLCVCVFMCKCVFHFDEEQSEPELAAPLGQGRKSSRDAGKYSRSSAGWKDCNQTINQKSLNCHPPAPPLPPPPPPPPVSFCYHPPTRLCRAPCIAWYVPYGRAYSALGGVNSRSMENAFSTDQKYLKSNTARKIQCLVSPNTLVSYFSPEFWLQCMFKETYWAHIQVCNFRKHVTFTLQCCSSSFQPLSKTRGFSSCRFKAPLLMKHSLLWLASWPTLLWLVDCFWCMWEMSVSVWL